MSVFVDTSAFFAVLDADDQNHPVAGRVWQDLVGRREQLICSNYVLLETFALVQRRLGFEAVRVFQVEVIPIVRAEWVDQSLHAAGVAALLTVGRRQLSLVDCVSFELMRRLGLISAFAFDQDFAEQGFTCLS